MINEINSLGVIILICILALISAILWISTLVYQIKRKQYFWFVITLICNVAYIIYWIVWLSDKKLRRKK